MYKTAKLEANIDIEFDDVLEYMRNWATVRDKRKILSYMRIEDFESFLHGLELSEIVKYQAAVERAREVKLNVGEKHVETTKPSFILKGKR